MDIQNIKSILDAIKDTDIEEIWFEKDRERSGFRRTNVSFVETGTETIVLENKKPSTNDLNQPTQASISTTSKDQINSTMVGTFLRQATPGGTPLIEEGDFVSVGQKVCIVEAMKVMKELTSPIAGKIIRILVADNHPVEYGQPLFDVGTQKHGTDTKQSNTEQTRNS